MKVALLTHEYPPYPGGIGRYCVEVAAAAITLGQDIRVFAPTHDLQKNDEHTPPSGVPITRFPGDIFSFHSILPLIRALRKILNPRSYDAIHIADWPMLLAYNLAFPLCKTPIIITLHGTDVFTLSKSAKARLLFSKQAFKRVNRVCANSAYTLSMAERELGVKEGTERVVTHLAASSYWSEQPTQAEISDFDSFMRSHDNVRHLLTTVARIDSRKGHRNALMAISKLPPDIRDHTLYVAIGKVVDESLYAELLALAKQLNVRAVFTGRRSDDFIRACYKQSAAFLLLAEPEQKKIEGFGLVFLEAASQGLHCIASNVHAIPEVVKDQVTGTLVDPHDYESIASAIQNQLNTRQSDLNRSVIINHAKSFSWKTCASLTYKW